MFSQGFSFFVFNMNIYIQEDPTDFFSKENYVAIHVRLHLLKGNLYKYLSSVMPVRNVRN